VGLEHCCVPGLADAPHLLADAVAEHEASREVVGALALVRHLGQRRRERGLRHLQHAGQPSRDGQHALGARLGLLGGDRQPATCEVHVGPLKTQQLCQASS
jgi:hypothetical protein